MLEVQVEINVWNMSSIDRNPPLESDTVTIDVLQDPGFNFEYQQNNILKVASYEPFGVQSEIRQSPVTSVLSAYSITIDVVDYQIGTLEFNPGIDLFVLDATSTYATKADPTLSPAILSRSYNAYDTMTEYKILDVLDGRLSLYPDTKATITILAKDFSPDYTKYLTNDCNQGLEGYLPEITVPARLGEYGTIFELPDSEKGNIETIYNKPFGISFDDRSIYGRLVVTKPVSMIVKLDNGKAFKLTVKPYVTDWVTNFTIVKSST